VDGQIDVPGLEAVGETLGHGDDREIDARRFLAESLQERR
jgi:hypothetical protein